MLGLLITVLCSPNFCTAQISDDFSDGDFSMNPVWVGDIDDFIINNALQLQLATEGSGSSYLSTNCQYQQNCEWQFSIKLGFSPSSNNNCRVYLAADNSNLTNEKLNGYFLQFGESGSNDAIELFRQNGNEIHSICRGSAGLISTPFECRIKITRANNGLWELFVDHSGNSLFVLEASGFDQEINVSGYFGFICKYTSSNSQKFYFDDIYIGDPIIDNSPPTLLFLEITQSNQIELVFSEPLDPICVQILENFSVDQGVGNPILIQTDEFLKRLTLFFSSSFEENKSYQLSFFNIRDFAGNIMGTGDVDFTYYIPNNNDLVINEILFDPLEGCEEYVEIYNKSQKILNFKSLKFGRIKYDFPNPPDISLCRISDSTIFIQPNEYWVLSSSPEKVNSCYYTPLPDHLIKVSNLPDLLNQEGHLFLISDSGVLIDEVKYREDMHHPILNYTDGVALEKIHFSAAGLEENGWQSATQNVGFGTPTYQNSQFSETSQSTEKLILNPEIFSPNQDGIDDFLTISLNLIEIANTINIYIFNSDGQQIRHLVKNELVGASDLFFLGWFK